MIQYIITEQNDGRFYGRIPDSDDGHGNEIDSLWPTPEEALRSLQMQLCPVCDERTFVGHVGEIDHYLCTFHKAKLNKNDARILTEYLKE